ncbi:MAG: aminomethyl-transferring glycine dehydrogenase subunit GcvPB, partial [Chloroflexi bacterium]|nr:aminomethyl-transferring glycine dehydrogenase subunit GcvPB [Chloroflexota bacterium]
EETVQGNLQVLHELQTFLTEITGMDAAALSPLAGAHGELTGILLIKAYHAGRGEAAQRRKVLVPDSAHGTNPATAALAGYQVVAVRSDANGNTDLDHLRSLVGEDVAGMMLTQPNTLGLFDTNILPIAELLHQHGALLYGDGANMNALLGRAKPGDLGFDVMHLNLHKTFSTPHGGGGPGAGPVCVKAHLAPFLPFPLVVQEEDAYRFARPEHTIGRMGGWYGNFGVLLRAYTYIRTLGPEGCRSVSENAVLNANYLRVHLQQDYQLRYHRPCMHEVVLSGVRQKARGVNTLAIAKRLIDYGFHPPTIYFPLIVEEALMIEPTETESKESLDAFIAAMRAIAREAAENPEAVLTAPHTTPVRKLDEAGAARNPRLRWQPGQSSQGAPAAAS